MRAVFYKKFDVLMIQQSVNVAVQDLYFSLIKYGLRDYNPQKKNFFMEFFQRNSEKFKLMGN